jgi:protein-disulfide isomerase
MTTQARLRPQQQQLTYLAAIAALAVVAVAAVILITGGGGSTRSDVEFAGIPQTMTEDGGHVLGNPDAPVTIVEFADFFCPVCQDYKPTVNRFIEEYVVTGQARFEYRFLPSQASQSSSFAAQIAYCASQQHEGGFWPVHEEMFAIAANNSIADGDIGRELARRLDLNYTDLLECSAENEATQQVSYDSNLANSVGVTGTPGIRVRYGNSSPQLINNSYASGQVPFEVLRSVVEVANLTGQ